MALAFNVLTVFSEEELKWRMQLLRGNAADVFEGWWLSDAFKETSDGALSAPKFLHFKSNSYFVYSWNKEPTFFSNGKKIAQTIYTFLGWTNVAIVNVDSGSIVNYLGNHIEMECKNNSELNSMFVQSMKASEI